MSAMVNQLGPLSLPSSMDLHGLQRWTPYKRHTRGCMAAQVKVHVYGLGWRLNGGLVCDDSAAVSGMREWSATLTNLTFTFTFYLTCSSVDFSRLSSYVPTACRCARISFLISIL